MKALAPTEPAPSDPEAPLQPTANHHLANFLVAGLLLVVVSMVFGLLEWDYDRYLMYKTSTIKGDGPMTDKDAFWFWVNEWLSPMLMVGLPTLASLKWLHWAHIFKRPGDIAAFVFVAELFFLSGLFVILCGPYLDHCWGIYLRF